MLPAQEKKDLREVLEEVKDVTETTDPEETDLEVDKEVAETDIK